VWWLACAWCGGIQCRFRLGSIVVFICVVDFFVPVPTIGAPLSFDGVGRWVGDGRGGFWEVLAVVVIIC
jgi:hypothetical protein